MDELLNPKFSKQVYLLANFPLFSADPCLNCDDNASCKGDTCVCNTGYLGDGIRCTSK